MSKIEKELLEASNLKPKKNEDSQAYRTRLCRAVAKISDDAWEGLSSEAQGWNNDAAEALKNSKDIADFPDAEEEVVEPTPKKEKETAKASTAIHSNRKVSACHRIKTLVAKKPTITVAELSEKLKGQGLKVSDVTIATLRSDFRDSLRVLNELEMGKYVL